MALVHQNNEPVSKNVVPNKMQRAPLLAIVSTVKTVSHHPLLQCASGMIVMKTLTALVALRIKNILTRGLQLETDSRHIPYWAMLEIQVDLQTEYTIIICARSSAALRRKAKEGQHFFIS